jgi:hypothetical protein
MKTESDREWSRFAWSRIRFGLIGCLGFGVSFVSGIQDFVSGSNYILLIVEMSFAAWCMLVAYGNFDEAWPWITYKLDKIIG